MDLHEEDLHVNQWEPYGDENSENVSPVDALKCILSYLDKMVRTRCVQVHKLLLHQDINTRL